MNKIKMYRGTSLVRGIKILKDGVPYIPNEGEIFRFGVKEAETSTRYIIKKEWHADEMKDGIIVLKITPKETIGLPVKTYKYDIGLQSDSGYQIIVPYSDFVIAPNITQWEEVKND